MQWISARVGSLEFGVALAVAMAIAVAIAAVELHSRLRTRITRYAAGWWLARVGLEAVAAIVAFVVLAPALPRDVVTSALGGLAVGIAVPAVLRMRFATIRISPSREWPIGVATLYEPLRNTLERQIDDIGAVHQATWVDVTVLPILASKTTPAAVVARAKLYVDGRTLLTADERAMAAAEFDNALSAPVDNADRMRAIVHILLELRAQRFLDSFVAEHGRNT